MSLLSRIKFLLIAALASASLCACDSKADDVPSPLYDFIARYYPSTSISDVQHQGELMVVEVSGGPTFWFNSSEAWVRIDGNGSTLSQMLLYDQLPQPLYRFIVEMEALDGVYAIERDATSCYAWLLDSTIRYDKATGTCGFVTDAEAAY